MQLGIACVRQQLQRGLVNSLWLSSCLFLLIVLSLSVIQYCGLLYLYVEVIWSSVITNKIRPLTSKTTSCLKESFELYFLLYSNSPLWISPSQFFCLSFQYFTVPFPRLQIGHFLLIYHRPPVFVWAVLNLLYLIIMVLVIVFSVL